MAIDETAGRQIADYRIESVLGRGGQGVVYLAEHAHLGRKVALKLLVPELATDSEFRSRFVREARIAASLDHPNILDVYDGGEAGGELYVAVRLVGGSDLATLLREQGRLSPDRALDILEPVAAALDFAHAHGLVHRDVKPGNILIEPPTRERDHEQVFLCDFGLTKHVVVEEPEARSPDPASGGVRAEIPMEAAELTRAGMFLGTPAFAAPEQVMGQPLTGAADQYALACVLFQSLTGELPFERDTLEMLLVAHVTEQAPSLSSRRPDLPARLDEVLARGMAKEPAARYPSCTALVQATRAVLRGSAKIFITYAREDRPFVERLHAALADRGRDTWVDWEGIPPSAMWMAQIRSAIDDAGAFVFVISPNSAESGSCREEYAHAEAANKRIIPIVYQEVDRWLLPQGLGGRNWIFFREGDDFETGMRSLLDAIDTGPGWVQTHTRLLTRAREWDGRGRTASLALRGAELTEAEQWLASARGQEPSPSPLHTEFILASRRQATKRQRSSFTAVTAALLVMALLAAGAFVQRQAANHQRNVARQQRDLAVREARLALSKQLTAQASPLLPTHLDLGLLLALQAFRTAHTLEARDVLLAGVQQSAHLIRFLRRPASSPLKEVAFSPDGKTLAVSGGGTVVMWGVATGRPIGSPLPGQAATFSPDGRILAVGNGKGPVTLLDPATGSRIGALGVESAAADTIAFGTGGRMLAVGSANGSLSLWDVGTRREFGPPFPRRRAGVFHVALSPDGKLLAVSTSLDVELWDVASRRVVAVPFRIQGRGPSFTVRGAFLQAAFSPNGKVLAVAGSADNVILWDVAAHRLIPGPLTGHTSTVESLAFSPDGRTLASGGADDTVILWDTETGSQIGEPLTSHTSPVTGVAFSPDGRTLASGGVDGTAILWNVSPRQPIEDSRTQRTPAFSVAFSPDGKTLAASGLPITLTDVATGLTSAQLLDRGLVAPVISVAFSPDGKTLAAATEGTSARGPGPPSRPGSGGPPQGPPGSSIVLWDVGTQRPAGRPIALPPREVTGTVAFSPDGRTLAAATRSGKVILWDAVTHRQSAEPIRGGPPITNIAFSPDGKTLAAGGPRITLVDVTTGRQSGMLPGGAPTIGVAFSPDGKTLAGGSVDGSVALWDVATRREVGAPLLGPTAPVTAVVFSPDGKIIAASSADHTVVVWDLATRRQIGVPLRASEAPVTSVEFSPDGSTLAAGSIDGTVSLWNSILFRFDFQAVQSRLCGLVGRNLTQSEWNQFLPGQPYQRTCPQLPAGP